MTVTVETPQAVPPAAETAVKDAPVVGIIYPPPEVRNIIDKTASFVVKNGEKFEERIKEKEAGNPKFNFLNSADPYYAYYRFKVKDFQEGKGQEPKKEEKKEEAPTKMIPKEPPSFEFITEMQPISTQDLDIMKLTAQFVARNGRQFLTGLSSRESRNYQFDFLRPGHSLFPYFTKLVEQYTKVLMPPKNLKETLYINANEKSKLLERVMERAEWIIYQEAEKKKAEDEAEKEREAYAAIDWHEFSVIGTIEFTGEEDVSELPAPITLVTLMQRGLVEKRINPLLPTPNPSKEQTTQNEDQNQVQAQNQDEEDMEMEIEDESPKEKDNEPEAPLPIPNLEGPIKIRKDYVPKALSGPKVKEALFMYNGVAVPASQLPQHMKIELLDPKWKEQREIEAQKNKETNLAPSVDISRNLQVLAKYRTDIFGEVELGIGKKAGEDEDKNLKMLKEQKAWDGHVSTIGLTAKVATIDEQLSALTSKPPEEQRFVVGPQVPEEVRPGAPPMPRPPIPTPNSVPPPNPFQRPPIPAGAPPPPNIAPPISAPTPHFPPPPPAGAPPGFAPPPPAGFPPGFPPPPPGAPHPFAMPPPGFPQPPGFPLVRYPNMTLSVNQPGPPGAPYLPPPGGQGLEPAAKRPKLDENGLIPEEDFIANNKGPVSFRVQIPDSADKGTWKLNGQTLNITLDITDTITKLKDKIQEETEMPTNKMNLRLDTARNPDALGFLRDAHSLGYYNVNNASIIQLLKKERGKKK